MAFDAYLPAGVRRIVGRDFPQDNTRWREKMKTRPVISNRHDGPVSAQFLSSRRSVAPQLFSRGASKVAAQTSDMIGMDASPVVDHTSRDEETMQNLIVVGFKGKHRASEVLGQLQDLQEDWALELDDAVAAYRTDDGRLRIDQSVNPTTKEGGAMGGVIGAMLGALLAAPFTGGASVAVAATAIGASAVGVGALGAAAGADDAATFKDAYGVSDDFVKEVGGLIQPGNSAVFAEVRTTDPQAIAQRFRGYGGTIIRTTLSPEKAAQVQDTIRAR